MPGFSMEDAPIVQDARVMTTDTPFTLPAEVTVYDPDSRTGMVGKASIVEGLLAESLASIKASLDYLYGQIGPDSSPAEEDIVNTFKSIAIDLMSMVAGLTGYHDAALKPKHRAVRSVYVAMLARMKDNDIQGGGEPGELARFAEDVVDFLECVHVCMLEGTTRQKRHYYKKRFIDG